MTGPTMAGSRTTHIRWYSLMVTMILLAMVVHSTCDKKGYRIWKFSANSEQVGYGRPPVTSCSTETNWCLPVSHWRGNGFKDLPGQPGSLEVNLLCLLEPVSRAGCDRLVVEASPDLPLESTCNGLGRARGSILSWLAPQIFREVCRFLCALASCCNESSNHWSVAE